MLNDNKKIIWFRRLTRGYIMSVIFFIIIMFATALFELIKRS